MASCGPIEKWFLQSYMGDHEHNRYNIMQQKTTCIDKEQANKHNILSFCRGLNEFKNKEKRLFLNNNKKILSSLIKKENLAPFS